MTQTRLILDIRSFWHPGTGRGAGTALDTVTHRDSAGLPVLPGRTLKGLLRDAVARAAMLGWYDGADPSHLLFGWRPSEPGETCPADLPARGALRVSDAALPQEIAAYLMATPKLLPGLYRTHFCTAVDYATGTAKEKSLRGEEMIVPLELVAQMTEVPGAKPPTEWPDTLGLALPLLRGLGTQRNRGLGRVVAKLEVMQ